MKMKVVEQADEEQQRRIRRQILVKAATKLLKKKGAAVQGADADAAITMDLVDLWKAVQKKFSKTSKHQDKKEFSSDAVVTLSELRSVLESSSTDGKLQVVGGDDEMNAAVAVRLVGKKDKKTKKRKLSLTLDPKPSSADPTDITSKKKRRRKNESGAAVTGSASSSSDDGGSTGTETVSQWRKKHKVVVMVEPASDDSNSSSPQREVKDEHLVPLQSFDDVAQLKGGSKVPLALLEALTSKFAKPSPIQAQSWPILLHNHNLVGIAETGSGKTLGFCLPALVRLAETSAVNGGASSKKSTKHRPVRMLVLSPTRELAMQSHEVLQEFGSCVGVSSLVVYGGVSKSEQERTIRSGNVDAIVATPGRLKDLIMGGSGGGGYSSKGRNSHRGGGGVLDLSSVQYLVLDEADRMLDLGFFPDVRYIVGQCTYKDRQTCLFSATWPASIQQMAAQLLQSNPGSASEGTVVTAAATVRVYVGFETIVKDVDNAGEDASDSASTTAPSRFSSDAAVVVVDDALSANKRVKQTIEVMEDHQRDARLRSLLSQVPKRPVGGEPHRVLVFCLYKKEAERLEHRLRQSGHVCTSIHGNKAQTDRTQALDKFKTGEIPLLIATDVAARGLHIPNVYMVINYTFPLTIEDYVHRIGRTGRAGQSGLSVTFFQPQHDKARAGELQQVLRQAGQDIPEALARFGSTIKKKEHKLYGNFGPSSSSSGLPMKKATKITFNYSDDEAGADD